MTMSGGRQPQPVHRRRRLVGVRAPRRSGVAGLVLAATLVVTSATTGWSGARPRLAAAALPPVSTVTVRGGPTHDGITPVELDLVAGTSDGTAAVLRRLDVNTGVKETWRWDGRAHDWTLLSSVPQPSTDLSQPGDAYGGTAGTMPVGQGQVFVYSGGRTFIQTHGVTPDYRAEMFVLGDDDAWHAAPCNAKPSGCAPGKLDGGASATNGTDTLLFGGQSPVGSQALSNQLWRWNGSDWDPLVPAGTPPTPRAAAGFFFDGRDFIVFGGGTQVGQSAVELGDTWRLTEDDTGAWSWHQVCDACGIPARFQVYAGGLYRSASAGGSEPGGLVVGGYQFAPTGFVQEELSDRWRWDGSGWVQIVPGGPACPQAVPGSTPACLTDPSIPFTPYVASMPALGAALWTAGSCNAVIAPPPGQAARQVCTRVTEQLTLDLRSTATTSTTVPASVAPTVTPTFTG